MKACAFSALLAHRQFGQISRSLAKAARSWMNRKRASGFEPISALTASAIAALVALADLDAQQRALLRVHRRFFELRRIHLAEAFEAAISTLALA